MSDAGNMNIYRNCQPITEARFGDDEKASLIEALTHALAEAEGVAPTDLQPLYDVIDVEGLSSVFDHHSGVDQGDIFFGFRFGVWNVFISGEGRIRVCDGTRRTDLEPVFES